MEDLKKLLAAATPGPWSEQDGSIGRFVKGRYEWSSIADVETAPDRDAAEGEGRANALLICAAVNALPELLERVKRLEADLQVIAFGWRYVAEPDNSFTKVDWTRDQLIEYARTALNQETGSFTDDPFNRAVLGLPLKETGQ